MHCNISSSVCKQPNTSDCNVWHFDCAVMKCYYCKWNLLAFHIAVRMSLMAGILFSLFLNGVSFLLTWIFLKEMTLLHNVVITWDLGNSEFSPKDTGLNGHLSIYWFIYCTRSDRGNKKMRGRVIRRPFKNSPDSNCVGASVRPPQISDPTFVKDIWNLLEK